MDSVVFSKEERIAYGAIMSFSLFSHKEVVSSCDVTIVSLMSRYGLTKNSIMVSKT